MMDFKVVGRVNISMSFEDLEVIRHSLYKHLSMKDLSLKEIQEISLLHDEILEATNKLKC